MKHRKAIDILRLAFAISGSTQPDKLTLLMRGPDDGLLGRFLWGWPDPLDEFRIGTIAPNAQWAIDTLDKLRLLEMTTAPEPKPIRVPLDLAGRTLLEEFGGKMQRAGKALVHCSARLSAKRAARFCA